MKILLIRPPYDFQGTPRIDLPIGLLCIAAVLEKSGYEIEYLDGVITTARICSEQGDNSNYTEYSWNCLKDKIREINPSIAIISCLYTIQFTNAIKLSKIIKEVNPAIINVVGGPHVSVAYKTLLNENPCFDILGRKEGEFLVKEVVETLEENRTLSTVNGIVFRENGKIIIADSRKPISELDSLPLPAYHLVDLEEYFALNKKFATRTTYSYKGSERGITLITSRGCPFFCTFCSVFLHMGRQWRYHSAEYVLRHMEFLINKYDVNYFHFEDDNLTADPRRFDKILDGIIQKKWKLRWDTPNGVRVDTLDFDLLKKSRQSGCAFMIIGVESGSQRVLNEVIKKKLDLECVKNIARLAQKARVLVRAFYMIGVPGETREEIRETVDFASYLHNKYNVLGGIGMAVPLLGTEVYKICKEKGYLTKDLSVENIAQGFLREGLIKTDEFDPEFLAEMIILHGKRNRRLKLKKLIIHLLREPRLIIYLLRRLVEEPGAWRHYISEIVYWHYLID